MKFLQAVFFARIASNAVQLHLSSFVCLLVVFFRSVPGYKCCWFVCTLVFLLFPSIPGDFCCWVRFAYSAVQLQPLKFCLFWGVLFLFAPIFVCLFACLVFFLLLFPSLPGDFCSWMGVACRAVQLQALKFCVFASYFLLFLSIPGDLCLSLCFLFLIVFIHTR